MSQTKIEKLTPEQEALIPFYREKWTAMAMADFAYALSTEPIDRQTASKAVKAAYKLFSFKEPKIICFDSPHQALEAIESQLEGRLCNLLAAFNLNLQHHLIGDLRWELYDRGDELLYLDLQDDLLYLELEYELCNLHNSIFNGIN